MFSALDARGMIVDAAVLDLYAGSGALAIEALSRGAARAVLVERDRPRSTRSRTTSTSSGSAIGPGSRGSNVVTLPRRAAARPRRPFDLVLADPPYDTSDDAVADAASAALAAGVAGAGAP